MMWICSYPEPRYILYTMKMEKLQIRYQNTYIYNEFEVVEKCPYISVIFHFQYLGNITSGLWTLSTTPEDLVRARYNTGTTPSPSGRHSASTGGKRRTDGHVTVAGQRTCQLTLWLIAGCYNFIQCFTRRRALVDFRDTS